jgi:hypothetical protein
MGNSLGGNGLTRRRLLTTGAAVLGAGTAAKIISAHAVAQAAPPKSAWKKLAKDLDGKLLRPGDTGYSKAATTFDPRRDGKKPVAIVRAASAGDVAAAFAFCRTYRVHPRPRSGGHSYVGASTGNGVLVIDVRPMHGVHYHADSHKVTVGAGAVLGDLHDSLDRHGRTVPTGTCPTVGAAGLTLGGGIGTESRLYGLTGDALTGGILVSPGGHIHKFGPHTDADLYWGLRGGGGGNFGILTSLTYATSPALPGTIFRLSWEPHDSHRVLLGWQERLADMPRHSWANLHLDTSGGVVRPSITGVCWDRGAGHEIAALAAAIGRQPSSRRTYAESHAGAMSWFAGGTNGHTRQSWYAGSDVVGHAISSSRATDIIAAVKKWNGSGSAAAIFDPLGGAVTRPGAADTAFRWRNAHATVQWYVGLGSTSRPNLDRAADWVGRCHHAIGRSSVGGYVNYLEPGRKLSDYYGGNYDRLLELNKKYDPHGILNSSYSLPG